MATQTFPAVHEHYVALTRTVKRWDRRLRLQQTLLWLPRSLLPGLALGLLLAVISWLRPWLLPQQTALITGALVALGVVIFALTIWLWRRPTLLSAQRFDHRFGFNERVSTALELGAQSIRSNDELTQGQMAFAHEKASAVRIGEHLPLEFRGRDWALAILMAALLGLLLILPNPQVDALSQASIQQQAINNAADQMRATTQDIAADTSLGNEQRRTLLEQLKTATNTLEQPNITPQEALAAVSNVESGLKNNADQLNQQSNLNQAALEQAANALRQMSGASPNDQQNQQQSGSSSMEQAAQNLNQMAQDVPNMTQAQQQQAQQALQNASQALQNTNPQAAQSLQQASQQMQQGNTQQAQQQMQQASQQMQQQAQQAQQQQQASQNLNQAAQQQQQSGQQISQSQQAQQSQQGQQQSQQNQSQSQQQQGQQSSQQNQQGQQSQQSQQQQGPQQNQQGQQSNQQSQQGQQGQQESQQGQQAGQEQGQQPGQQSQQGQQPGQQGQQTGQEQGQQSQQSQPGQSSAQQGGALSAGDSPGDPRGDDNGQQQNTASQGSATTNNPDGQGVQQFESVNVPRRLGDSANDGNNVQLDPDASNTPLQEGNFTQNPNGQVTVPYNQVFSDYADAANQALNSDYVPLGLRDVVRDYFTSLEPKK